MKELKSANFNIIYEDKKYDYQNIKNILIYELYKSTLYSKLLKKLEKYRSKYIVKHPEIDSNDKTAFPSISLLIDLTSLAIMSHNFNSNFDPMFDNTSPFEKHKLEKILRTHKCISLFTDTIIEASLYIIPNITKYYFKYYDRLTKRIKQIEKVEYELTQELVNTTVLIKLKIVPSKFSSKISYNDTIIISKHIFNHLVKLYNTKMFNKYETSEILDINVLTYIYMVFNRYFTLSSGNNQASILPSFKKLIKENFNIKIELFGSPINTSSATFGSYFYDIDYVFGSIGDYFKTEIKKGYYEVNPPFERCLIDNVMKKSLNELDVANENKLPLLFLFVLPYSYFKYNVLPKDLSKYTKINILVPKEKFPYIRYNRTFTKTNVSAIVNTKLILCHTDYISSYVSENVKKFIVIFNEWCSKNNKNIESKI